MYHYSIKPAQLTLLKEMNHPESKLRNGALTSDKEGHYKANDSGRGAYSPHMEAHEVEIDNFAREIARELNQQRNANKLDQLFIIAPAHMYGLLANHINKHVENLLINHLPKDGIHLSERELLDLVKLHVRFPGEK